MPRYRPICSPKRPRRSQPWYTNNESIISKRLPLPGTGGLAT
jgi:hypothetical protein